MSSGLKMSESRVHDQARAIAERAVGELELGDRLDVGVVVGRGLHVGLGPEVAELGLLELQRLDGAPVVGRGHVLHLDAEILLELGEDGRPAPRDLGGVLGGQERKRHLLGPARIGGVRRRHEREHGQQTAARTWESARMENPPSVRWPPAARGTDTTSMHITMATIKRITVAASPILERPDGVPEVEADAAAAHHPDDRRRADVGLEAQQHVREEVRHDLGHDAERDHVERGPRRPRRRLRPGRDPSPRSSRSGACPARRPCGCRARACPRTARARPR